VIEDIEVIVDTPEKAEKKLEKALQRHPKARLLSSAVTVHYAPDDKDPKKTKKEVTVAFTVGKDFSA
jgi:hypothetical protein